ncbi:MAG: hypothetical protein ACFB6R_11680 [Alphaproteobacteria bacterium]
MTLLEVLMALMLTALLVAAMAGTLAMGGRVWERYGLQGQDASAKAMGLQALRGLLEQIRPVPRTGPGGARLNHVRGGPDWLVFLADPGPLSPVPGLRAYRLVLDGPDADGDRRSLMLESGRPDHRVTGNRLAGVEGRSILLPGLTDWRIAYRPGPGAPWQDTWIDGPDIPALVRIDIVYDNTTTERVFVAPRRARNPLAGGADRILGRPEGDR